MQVNWGIIARKRKIKEGLLSLSPTGVSNFIDCDLCGYRKFKRLQLPRNKYPSLPNGVDRVLKDLSNLHRLKGKPPELWGRHLPGRRLYREPPKKLSWKWEELSINVEGEPDEWVTESDGTLSVVDFKTRGFPLKEVYPSYKLQADFYGLLSERVGGFPPLSGRGYLVYLYPEVLDATCAWHVEVEELDVNPKRAREFIKRIVPIIRGPIPKAAANCEICSYLTRVCDWMAGRDPLRP